MELTYDEIFNPIKGREQKLIEVFVEFYGEKWRDKITQRINNTTFLSLNKQPVYRIEKYFNLQLTRIEKEYADEVGFVKQNYITKPEKLKHVQQELQTIKVAIESDKCDNIFASHFIPIEDFVKALGIDYGTDIVKFVKDENNYNLIYNKTIECQNVWNEKYSEQSQRLHQNCKEIIDELWEAEREFKYISDKYKRDVQDYIGQYLLSKTNLDDESWEFGTYSKMLSEIIDLGQNKLQDDISVSNDTQKKYIQLFKVFGFDYGDDYDKYINDTALMNIVFNPKLIEHLGKMNKEYRINKMRNNQQFMQAFEIVKNLDARDGSFEIMEGIYDYLFNDSSVAAAYCQQYIGNDGQLKNICVCPLGVDLCDATLIHELGHAIQCDIMQDSGDKVVVKSGFDIIEYKPIKKDFDIEDFVNSNIVVEQGAPRPYEMLNEVMHDYMMRTVADKMNSKGITFGKSEGFVSGYVHGYRMMSNFIHQNSSLIKDAQMDSSPYVLRDVMGEDNYNKLAKAVEDCVEICQDLRSFKIMREIEKVADTNQMTMFDIAHIEQDWSPTTRKYLDTFIMAEEVFNGFNNAQILKSN